VVSGRAYSMDGKVSTWSQSALLYVRVSLFKSHIAQSADLQHVLDDNSVKTYLRK